MSTTRADRVRGSPPTKSEKFSDLASGVHAALGGPLTALERRPIPLLCNGIASNPTSGMSTTSAKPGHRCARDFIASALVTLSSRASEGTNCAHVAAWSPRFSRSANASRARLGGRQRVYDPRGQQDHQRLYRAWRSDHSRIIRAGLAPACPARSNPHP